MTTERYLKNVGSPACTSSKLHLHLTYSPQSHLFPTNKDIVRAVRHRAAWRQTTLKPRVLHVGVVEHFFYRCLKRPDNISILSFGQFIISAFTKHCVGYNSLNQKKGISHCLRMFHRTFCTFPRGKGFGRGGSWGCGIWFRIRSCGRGRRRSGSCGLPGRRAPAESPDCRSWVTRSLGILWRGRLT